MDPLTIGLVVIPAITSLAQLYQAEKARKAEKRRLKEIEDAFNALVPPEFDVSIMDPPELITQKIPPASFDMSKISPAQFKLIAQYAPEIAPYVAEQNPSLIEDTAAGKEGREMQLETLRRMRDIARSEVDPELAQRMDLASRRAGIDLRGRVEAIEQAEQRKGIVGGGRALASKLSAAEAGTERQALESRQAAVESYRNRLAAGREAANLGGNITASERQMAAQNVDIINDFNQRTSASYQDWLQKRVATLNAAQLRNIGEAQRISEANESARYAGDVSERERADQITKYGYESSKEERDYQNALAQWRANFMAGQKNLAGQQTARGFEAASDIVAGRLGIGKMQNEALTQQAKDISTGIGGTGQAASMGALYYGSNQSANSAMIENRRLAYFQRHGRWPTDEEIMPPAAIPPTAGAVPSGGGGGMTPAGLPARETYR